MKSDIELVVEFRRGDSSAFQRLVRRHHVPLFNFFYMLTGSERVSEALAARAFMRIYADREKLGPDFNFATYLYRAGINCWTDFRKMSAASASLTENSAAAGKAGEHEGETLSLPSRRRSEVMPSAASKDLLRILECLPAELRLLLVLKEISHFNYQEIGSMLELSAEGVRRRASGAYQVLRIKTGLAVSSGPVVPGAANPAEESA